MSSATPVLVLTDDLQVGCVLEHPVNDPTETLLLAGGVKISEHIKAGLKKRNIDSVFLHPDDVERASGVAQRSPDITKSRSGIPKGNGKAKAGPWSAKVSFCVSNTGQAAIELTRSPGAVPYDAAQRQRITEEINTTASLLGDLIDDLFSGSNRGATELASAATDCVSELTEDGGHVIATAHDLAQRNDFSLRIVRMSILSMAIAIELGFDLDNVKEVGVAALVHDLGLFTLDEKFRTFDQPMTSDDWVQYEKHPIKSVDLLEGMADISGAVRLASYQVHERLDGSGFPKGRQGEAIHPFARIIAVADVYISLVSQIRGRPALIPYDAIVCLLHQVKRGKLDGDVARALLRSVSMFPIGSHVQLNDNSEAKVLRSNGSAYMTPIVEKLPQKQGVRIDAAHESIIIDLADSPLTPVAPLITPGHREMRLDQELLDEIVWEGPGS